MLNTWRKRVEAPCGVRRSLDCNDRSWPQSKLSKKRAEPEKKAIFARSDGVDVRSRRYRCASGFVSPLREGPSADAKAVDDMYDISERPILQQQLWLAEMLRQKALREAESETCSECSHGVAEPKSPGAYEGPSVLHQSASSMLFQPREKRADAFGTSHWPVSARGRLLFLVDWLDSASALLDAPRQCRIAAR